jgi:uncharacterized protein YciI
MHFMIAGYLKPGAEEKLIDYHQAFNEHVGQSAHDVVIAGVLRNEEGRRVGYVAVMETEHIDRAQTWLSESPLYQAGLYERSEIYEYQNEIGHIR